MTNDAAERLRTFIALNVHDDDGTTLMLLDQALAAERRATVERIRAAVEGQSYEAWDGISDAPAIIVKDLDAILDALAAKGVEG